MGNAPPPLEDDHPGAPSASAIVNDPTQTRDTIIERLRRFFRSRPSIESLKEKGIYKRKYIAYFEQIYSIRLGIFGIYSKKRSMSNPPWNPIDVVTLNVTETFDEYCLFS